MISPKIEPFRDSLGAAHSYIHAMRVMIETVLGNGDHYCSLDLLATNAQEEINKVQSLVDEMEGGQS
ncbi:hypothetical protein P6U16_01355 [Rhizobium sp. 32-5/1]|uniref:hypothetical protein n=1 Tax=Rhizobium sp. 32-5/1 TaxID=3019602 RepID=UPI00240E18AC|nr:hypothetical protein [Rhizobium sp. 32-5/1]WEZ83533.1 hypothetical protein P6U16_01355 [Rhizobium sp. 32-5/1]